MVFRSSIRRRNAIVPSFARNSAYISFRRNTLLATETKASETNRPANSHTNLHQTFEPRG